MAFTIWTSSVDLQILYIKRMDIPNYIKSTFVYQILHAIGVGRLVLEDHSSPPNNRHMNTRK